MPSPVSTILPAPPIPKIACSSPFPPSVVPDIHRCMSGAPSASPNSIVSTLTDFRVSLGSSNVALLIQRESTPWPPSASCWAAAVFHILPRTRDIAPPGLVCGGRPLKGLGIHLPSTRPAEWNESLSRCNIRCTGRQRQRLPDPFTGRRTRKKASAHTSTLRVGNLLHGSE